MSKAILFGQHLGYCASKSWIIFRAPFKYLLIAVLIFGLTKALPALYSTASNQAKANITADIK